MPAGTGFLRARLALGWMILGEWRAHPARWLLTAAAIAIGVALGFAVHLVNGSALASFEGALNSVNGAADVQVNARTPLGFDERLYPRLLALRAVSDASPVVKLDARAGTVRLTLLGLDAIRAAQVTPSLIGIGASPGDAFAEDALFLSTSARRALGVRTGARIVVSANGHAVPLRLVGTLPGVAEGQNIAVVDIAVAQWRFGRLGRLDRIDLKRADGADDATLATALPADAVLGTARSDGSRTDALSRAYRVNLDMLALVALLTGGFLVFSAQSLSVARRLRAFALVRTLGLPRAGIVATVAAEGLVIGLVGASAGLAVGYALAWGALSLLGGDLGAGYFNGGGAHLVFAPWAAAGFFALGLVAAVGGSVVPARIAARAAPAAALRNTGDMIDPRASVAWAPALVLIVIGGVAALLPALILAGGIAGMPWLARTLLTPLSRRSGRNVPLGLALRHLHGAPGQAATALCGIVASTALMIAMAMMVFSFRGAVDTWLGQVLSADLYLRTEGNGTLDRQAQAKLAGIPGIARVAFSRQIPLALAADRPPVVLIARPVASGNADASLVLIAGSTNPGPGPTPGAVPVWVSEPAARLYHWQVGDSVTLPFRAPFRVAGVWRDYARQQGAIVMRDGDYARLTGDQMRDEAAIMLRPGARADAVTRTLHAAAPGVAITEPQVLRRFALKLFDRSFAVTYLLEAIAILVGLAGVAATMSAQTIARTREFGMLRHIGVSRRQITAMLASEGAALGAIGGIAGIGLGAVLAQVLIQVINPQSFNWTMATLVPWGTIFAVALALVVAASLTAILAGRRATAIDAVRAVREDW
jgi:putative ABC transport system permease protein